MARIIEPRHSKSAIKLAVFFLSCFVVAIAVQYYYPADIDQICEKESPTLVNNIHSCSLTQPLIKDLEHQGYTPIVLESSESRRGPFKAKFDYKIYEVQNFKIHGASGSGPAQFRFINGRLSSIVYTPKKSDSAFELYPENKSTSTSIKHSSNHEGLKYITWSNNQLESYISWWIWRFA
ncbi:hypothetical protein [Pseudomonas sp. RA_105y_Pfl2_P56]|uniref:hypothetical protein n=1 Tax=Pseudomonas sp. RA_105y_Pfl2_P56 TaxID=3088701 RepID=UPI0030DC7F5E